MATSMRSYDLSLLFRYLSVDWTKDCVYQTHTRLLVIFTCLSCGSVHIEKLVKEMKMGHSLSLQQFFVLHSKVKEFSTILKTKFIGAFQTLSRMKCIEWDVHNFKLVCSCAAVLLLNFDGTNIYLKVASRQTLRNILHVAVLRERRPAVCLSLTVQHSYRRFQFELGHLKWD